jgi:hypothetical protein
VIATCTKPIDRLDAAARARHQVEMRAYKAALATWKAADGKSGIEEPRHPRLARYLVESATIEAMSEVLRDDDEAKQRAPACKVLCRLDEMSEWLANLDRYRAGGRGGGDRALISGSSRAVDTPSTGSGADLSLSQTGPLASSAASNQGRSSASPKMPMTTACCNGSCSAFPGHQAPGLDRKPISTPFSATKGCSRASQSSAGCSDSENLRSLSRISSQKRRASASCWKPTTR